MDRRLDHKPDTILELTQLKPAAGMWCYPTDVQHCCIYRVPQRLRQVNPEAYTPQLVLIGPLSHSLKSKALEFRGDIEQTKFMGYLNMEEHKKIYLAEFTKRVGGKDIIEGFKTIIQQDEDIIRASYSETMSWIETQDFVEMILLDSVFILEHILRIYNYCEALRLGKKSGSRPQKTGDIIVDDPCLQTTIKEDLMLLENQLPYFILEKLFDLIVPQLCQNQKLRNLVLDYFSIEAKMIHAESKFMHFTDLFRCGHVDALGSGQPSKTIFRYLGDMFRCGRKEKTKDETLEHMYNAEKLYGAGIEFVAVKNLSIIDVRFENGCLKIPTLCVSDNIEMTLRNIMALEQCHYPSTAHVSNYVALLDYLIVTENDVDLLVEKGILYNWIGEQRSVVELVNKLNLGIVEDDSIYTDIGNNINAYYESRYNRTRAVLCRQYFANLWAGTATVVATILLVMTLIQTVISVIQARQK